MICRITIGYLAYHADLPAKRSDFLCSPTNAYLDYRSLKYQCCKINHEIDTTEEKIKHACANTILEIFTLKLNQKPTRYSAQFQIE